MAESYGAQVNPYTQGSPTPAGPELEPDTASAAEVSAGLEYHRVYRSGRPGWGWYVGGVATFLILFFVVSAVVVVVVATVLLLVTGTSTAELGDKVSALAATDNATPSVLLFLNAVLVLGIPAAWFCTRVFHRVRPRWLSSVAPRIRWTWLLASFGVALVALVAAILLGALLPGTGEGEDLSGGVNAFTGTTRDFLLVILLVTPFQAAAEEYAFRGYLTQAFGGLVRGARVARYVAVLVPAVLFALAHGAQSVPIFIDRLAFGVVAGILVIATGGLEAGIAYHVLNNLIAFSIPLFFGDISTVLTPTGGSWWDVVVSFAKSAIFVALSIVVARRMGVQTRTSPGVSPGVLERSRGRV